MTQPVPTYAAPAPATPWNVLSIVSLVGSLVGLGLVGVIAGHIALSQIKRTREQGHVLALIGLILGYVEIAVVVLGGIAWILFFLFVGTVATVGN